MTLVTLLLVAVTATQTVDASEVCPPSAEADYQAGFDAMVNQKDEEALAAFERVLSVCPQHPNAAEFARLVRARLDPGDRVAQEALAQDAAPEEDKAPARGEVPTRGARAAVIVGQTIHGATQGLLLCAIVECKEQGYPSAGLLGAGVGLTTSLLAARGLTPGQAGAINSGTVWGFWFGVASLVAFDLEDDEAIGAAIAGGAGFTGLGILLAGVLQPTAGQVSMANSGGLWAGALTALFLTPMDRLTVEDVFRVELGATAGGLLAFAVLSSVVPVSRGRMLLIDAGGIIGGLAGASFVFSFLGEESGDGIAVGTGVGALAGLALTTYLTRNFDGRGPEVALAPTTMGRGGTGLALVGTW